jgi:peptidoglycan/LPS O-acetylase OafA/YrhL
MIGRYWGPLNLIRWALTIFVMVFLNQHSVAQIFILSGISAVFQILMLIGKPMIDKWDKRINWMIEVSVSIYLYVLLSLTDFMGETTIREELGWVLTILTGIVVAVNLSIFFWKTFWKSLAYFKQLFARLSIQKARKGLYK